MVKREFQLGVRLSAEEWASLQKVAHYYGLSGTDVVRMLLKDADRKIQTWTKGDMNKILKGKSRG